LLLGEVGIVAGWGRLSEGGKLPNILQYVSTYNQFQFILNYFFNFFLFDFEKGAILTPECVTDIEQHIKMIIFVSLLK